MTRRSASLVFFVAACQGSDANRFPIGPGDGPPRPIDAYEFHDAKVYKDAKVFEDAHVFLDAAPPVRSCVNVQPPVLFQGNESLTIKFVCGSPSDATEGQPQVLLQWTDDHMVVVKRSMSITLNCGTMPGQVVNQFLTFQADFVELAIHISGPLFDVDCQ